jgi:hypothetical protein
VTGLSPVVDTVHTTGNTTLVQDQLRSIPMGGTMQEMLPLAAGVTMQDKPDVGDSNLASRSAIVTYGVVLQTTLDVEGINTVTDHAANTAVYFNSFSLEEVQFKTSGNNADIGFPGVAQVALLKSGSNTFHGTARGAYENPNWQNNNVTPRRSPRRASGRPTRSRIRASTSIFDIGGRVVKDKLWFYGAHSNRRRPGPGRVRRRPERGRVLVRHLRRHDAGDLPHSSPAMRRRCRISCRRTRS